MKLKRNKNLIAFCLSTTIVATGVQPVLADVIIPENTTEGLTKENTENEVNNTSNNSNELENDNNLNSNNEKNTETLNNTEGKSTLESQQLPSATLNTVAPGVTSLAPEITSSSSSLGSSEVEIATKVIKAYLKYASTYNEALIMDKKAKSATTAVTLQGSTNADDPTVYVIDEYTFAEEDPETHEKTPVWDVNIPVGLVIKGHVVIAIKDGVHVTINKDYKDISNDAGILCAGQNEDNSVVITSCTDANDPDEPEGTGVLEVYGGTFSAAIGGTTNYAYHRNCYDAKNITIKSCTIYAYGGQGGAGIGGASDHESKYQTDYNEEQSGGCDNINIEGGTVYAYGGSYAAGIGGGDDGKNSTKDSRDWYSSTSKSYGARNITIDGGKVYAYGGYHASGIGGGNMMDGHNITINDGYVEAYAGEDAAGIGSGHHESVSGTARHPHGFNILITGGTVKAYGGYRKNEDGSLKDTGHGGAGIGSSDNEESWGIMITGGDVYAKGGPKAAAIGGGRGGRGSYMDFCGGNIVADSFGSGCESTGIGSGSGEDAEYMDFYGDVKVTAYGYLGAAIGSGAGSGSDTKELRFFNYCDIVAIQNGEQGAAIGAGKDAKVKNGYLKVKNYAHIEAINNGTKGPAIGNCRTDKDKGDNNIQIEDYAILTDVINKKVITSMTGPVDDYGDATYGWGDIREVKHLLIERAGYKEAINVTRLDADNPVAGYESTTRFRVDADGFSIKNNPVSIVWYSDKNGTVKTSAPSYLSTNAEGSQFNIFDFYTCPNKYLSDLGITPAGTYYFRFEANVNGETVKSDVQEFTIDKKKVNIQSLSATKTYDGKPLSREEISDEEIVIAQKTSNTGNNSAFTIKAKISDIFRCNNFASITDKGTVDNSFEYDTQKGYDIDNFDVSTEYGTLEVTMAPVVVQADSYKGKYDGEAHGGSVKTYYNGMEVTPAYEYSVDGGQSWSSEEPEYTNAGTYNVKVKATFGGTEEYAEYSIVIEKRDVTFTSASGSKSYDKTPLTVEEVIVGGDGVVEKDEFVFSNYESITLAGEKENKFDYESSAKDNYNITKKYGKLTITPIENPITVSTGSHTKKYDGKAFDVPEDDYTYTDDILLPGDTLTVTLTNSSPSEEDANINAGTYSNSLKNTGSGYYKVVDDQGNDVTGCYTFAEPVLGELTIEKRSLYLMSKSAVKIFDGEPLSREEVIISGDGIVEGEKLDFKDFTQVTEVTEKPVDNEFSLDLDGEEAVATGEGTDINTRNYDITIQYGKLMVVEDISVIGSDRSFVYDGTDHECGAEASEGAAITYSTSTDGETWSDYSENVPVINDAGTLYIKAKATKGVQTAETQYIATVEPRSVILTSASATGQYNGNDLTKDEVMVSGNGFVGTDGASYTVTGKQKDVGSSNNSFTYSFNNGTKAGNYNVTTIEGTLEVTKNLNPVTITTGSDTQMYSGVELTSSDWTYEGTIYQGDQLVVENYGSITNVGTAKNPCTIKVLRDGVDITDYYTFADSVEGTLSVNPRQIEIVTDSSGKKYDGIMYGDNGYRINGDGFVGTDGITVNVTGSIKDAGQTENSATFEFKEGTDSNNYNVKVTPGTLTINQRQVILTTGSAISVSPEPASNSNVDVGGDGFVAGEVTKCEATTVMTERIDDGHGNPGYILNDELDIELAEDAKASNYKVTVNYGKLMVINAGEAATVVSDYSGKYDGKPHSGQVIAPEGVTLQYSTDGINWQNEMPEYTDAGNYQFKVKATKAPNYQADFTVNVNIIPRDVTITGGSASKVYDKTPLTCSDYIISGDGFVNGEGAIIGCIGSRTNVGIAENEVHYDLGNNTKEGNYNITVTNGSLEVTKRNVVLVSAGLGLVNLGHDPVLYDGESHSQEKVLELGMGFAKGEGATYYNFTNATDAGLYKNEFSYSLNNSTLEDNYNIVKRNGLIRISQRDVKIVSASDSKMYDGTPLINMNVFQSGSGFIEGEGATYNVTGSQTDVGISANSFTYKLNGSTKFSNYTIEDEEGILQVYSADTLRIEAPDKLIFEYDGDKHGEAAKAFEGEEEISEDEIWYSTDEGINWVLGDPEVAWAHGTTDVMARIQRDGYDTATVEYTIQLSELSIKAPEECTFTYDGEFHGDAAKAYLDEKLDKDAKITYSTDGGNTWSDTVPQIKDVGTVNVIAKAEKEDFTEKTVEYTLEVNPVEGSLRIEKPDQTVYEYDKEKHGKPARVFIDDKEIFDADVTYSTDGGKTWSKEVPQITEIGKLDVIAKVEKQGYKEDTVSYTIEVKEHVGTLKIEAPKTLVYKYDGEYHGDPARAFIDDEQSDDVKITYSTDGGNTWSENVPQIRDIGKLDVIAKAEKDGYNTATVNYTIEVSEHGVTPIPDPKGNNNANTGDKTNMGAWIGVMVASVGSVVTTLFVRKKKKSK